MSTIKWFWNLIRLKPHFYVGGKDNPYLIRWYLIPRNKWFNLYLHKFMRDDEDRALHDHPWWFISFMIWGSYGEFIEEHTIWPSVRLGIPVTELVLKNRHIGSIRFNNAEHKHRVVLPKDNNGKPKPCWTIVLTGSTTRKWGFWCPKGFVPWDEFCDPKDPGLPGKGCD